MFLLLLWCFLLILLVYLFFRYGYTARRYALYGKSRHGKLVTGYAIDLIVVSHILPLLVTDSPLLCGCSAFSILFVILFLADNCHMDWQLQQMGLPFYKENVR